MNFIIHPCIAAKILYVNGEDVPGFQDSDHKYLNILYRLQVVYLDLSEIYTRMHSR